MYPSTARSALWLAVGQLDKAECQVDARQLDVGALGDAVLPVLLGAAGHHQEVPVR